MADKKISQLTQAITPLSGGELVPIVQNGETVKVNVGNLRADTSEFVKDSDLADVATSGDYNDLVDTPTIPTTDNFVEKTGDTMTGALNINAGGVPLLMTGIEFRINSGVSFGGFLRFMNTSGQMSVGMTGAASNDFLISDRKNSHNAAKYQGDLNKWSFYTDNTERLHINELGNVGINTTNPQAKLDVNGDVIISGTGAALTVPNGSTVLDSLQVRGSVNNSVTIDYETALDDISYSLIDLKENNSTTWKFVGRRITGSNYSLELWGQTGKKLHISQDGNVGIGVATNTIGAKLDVNGDLRTDSLLEKSKSGSVSGGSYFLIWDSYGNHDIILTQNTEILQGDIPPVGYSQVITLNVIGDFALTLPVEWVVKNGGTYDGVNGSQIVVQSWDNGNFYTVIN